jgi:hypothetical protein
VCDRKVPRKARHAEWSGVFLSAERWKLLTLRRAGMFSGCVAGAALQAKSGPAVHTHTPAFSILLPAADAPVSPCPPPAYRKAAGLGCAGFAAFSALMDSVMGGH